MTPRELLDMSYFAELVAAAMGVAVTAGSVAITRVTRRKTATPPATCVGYMLVQEHPSRVTMHHDCEALRSPACLDGRCSFHCNCMCRCCAPGRHEA